MMLSQAFQSHKADVLALCVDAAGTSVFTSGVDPAVVQFEFMPVSETSDWSIWVRTTVHLQHSHDVRALTLTETSLVSAGTWLVFLTPPSPPSLSPPLPLSLFLPLSLSPSLPPSLTSFLSHPPSLLCHMASTAVVGRIAKQHILCDV